MKKNISISNLNITCEECYININTNNTNYKFENINITGNHIEINSELLVADNLIVDIIKGRV
jgi:hypothetical protein